MVNILILHPDLGIGGAERLILDVGLALKARGHNVAFITNHHDPMRCFVETVDGTFPVNIIGSWFPRHLFGKFAAACAYIRFLLAALYCVISVIPVHGTDIVICDQISIIVPLIKWFSRVKVLFYCHFPDKLLSQPGGILKQWYRKLIDTLEEVTTGTADRILVNSSFTAKVFARSFPKLAGINPAVVHPSIATSFYDDFVKKDEDAEVLEIVSGKKLFLSLNRFEEKKNHRLALEAFAALQNRISVEEWERCFLVIAGGYDERLTDNIECYKELKHIISDYRLESKVQLMKSVDEYAKATLLIHSLAILYTPSNEHFGIVPLEAMHCSKPVIAVNSGGPCETVVHGETGFLENPEPEEFAARMAELIKQPELAQKMGESGRLRFYDKFGFDAFSIRIGTVINELCSPEL